MCNTAAFSSFGNAFFLIDSLIKFAKSLQISLFASLTIFVGITPLVSFVESKQVIILEVASLLTKLKSNSLIDVKQKWDVIGPSVLDVQSLFFWKNCICAMTRHHAEPNIKILLTRNLPFDSDVRQWSHPLMIPLHCLWAKSKNRTRGWFECDMTRFCFCFAFVRSHARCSSCSIVCLRF